jgi:hypothetical protein
MIKYSPKGNMRQGSKDTRINAWTYEKQLYPEGGILLERFY